MKQNQAALRGKKASSTNKILVPVRYSAWLSGELGSHLRRSLARRLDAEDIRAEVSKLPRSMLVEAPEAAGPLLEATVRAMRELEIEVATRFPVFHHEMGPVWTGTLQSIFTDRKVMA